MNEKTLRVLEYNKIIRRLERLASSELGKALVQQLSPVKDYDQILQLQKETGDGVSVLIRKGNPPLGGIHDLRESIKRVEAGGVLNPGELLKVSGVLRASRNLKSYACADEEQNDNIIVQLAAALYTNKRIEDRIDSAIISEEEIADGASSVLASIRRQIRDKQSDIKDKLNSLVKSQKYQKFMQDPIVTMRGDRYVVPVKAEYRSEVQGLVHDASSSGATLFIEPIAVVEANNAIKQLQVKELAEIERILAELTSATAEISQELISNISILARLDFIFAKAKLSLDLRAVSPQMNREKRIIIKKGRHPLLDASVVVPIDLWIGKDFQSLIITGPNTGGKTVTLKTVGLFTLMAQSGLHVPAGDGTELAVFHSIYADIGDEQSIEQSLSTFSSHMKNIVEILNQADENSLCLFDELGAGTDPTEGAALAMSILECLHQTGSITLATTHYSELKIYALTTKGVQNASCEFNVETLKPTYRLLIGVPGKSNAFAISSKLGLDPQIIERSKEFLTQEDIRFEDVLQNIEANRAKAEEEKVRAESYRLEIQRLKEQLEEQKNRLDRQRDELIRKSREDARKILFEAKQQADTMLADIRRLQQESNHAAALKEAEEIRNRVKNKLNKIEASLTESAIPKKGYVKPPENLKAGDSVLIVNLNQRGTVVSPPDKNGEAIIQAGIMKINVHITNLKLVDEQKESVQKSGIGKISVSKSQNISTEIDLRGRLVEEAVLELDKYIDDAALANLKELTIIHGKGTGALRTGIHKFLRGNRHVRAFRLGTYGEGESGVTIVELK